MCLFMVGVECMSILFDYFSQGAVNVYSPYRETNLFYAYILLSRQMSIFLYLERAVKKGEISDFMTRKPLAYNM